MRDRSILSTPRPTSRCLRPLSALLFPLCLCGLPHAAFAQSPSAFAGVLPNTPVVETSVRRPAGAITGSVSDQDGDSIPGAKVTLSRETQGADGERQTVSDGAGDFAFDDVASGTFAITVTASGFTAQHVSGALQEGQQAEIPQVLLHAAAAIDVEVTASQHDIAQDEIGVEEKQRVLGVIPNFYVTYERNPAPLAPKQKLELAWKMSVDPVNFMATGLVAGIEQSQNAFAGYGPGAAGYAKRYSAAFADGVIGTTLSSAVLPVVFRQDPRYFYQGTASIRSRVLHAIASAVICRGDNGRLQPNYSNILGNFASAGISNLYYPRGNRDGVRLTFEEALVGLAAGAGGNLFQEFLIRRITPRAHHRVEELPR